MKIKNIIPVIIVGGLILGACDISPKESATAKAQRSVADQQNAATQKIVKNQPAPSLNFSTDRAALIKRYNRTANPSFKQYIAVLTLNGGVMYTGVVKGKVTPLDSQLTPADALDCEHYGAQDPRPDGCGVVQIAEPNGTWGTNGSGIFWFDDQDGMHETNMPYMLSDQPFTVTTPPILNIVGGTKVGH